MDTLIPHSHSQDLHANCPTESFIHLPEKMDHNEFHLEDDLVKPFRAFLEKLGEIVTKNEEKDDGRANIL